MGIPVLILGESGTGKSASLRNFPNDKVAVINVAGKPLPFKNKITCFNTDDYMQVEKHIRQKSKECKSIVVDDAQYLMANEFMRRATERGFDKFTDIAKNFWTLINMVKELPNDVIVYFLAHIERDANGNEKIKTIGKMLDEKITVEGMFTIVLKTNVTDGQYSFLTQNNGHDTVKSPIGLFPSYVIDNDLNYVDEKIRNYYEVGEFLSDDEMAEIDEIAKKYDIPIDDGKKKRGRRSAKKEEPEETLAEEAKEETKSQRRRKAIQEDNDNDNESVEPASSDVDEETPHSGESSDEVPTGRRRRRSVNESMAEERAAVAQENAEAIANAGMEEAGENEEVDFEKVETPELKEPPRRKRRGAAEAAPAEEPVMNPPETEETEASTTGASRRRRRRG